MALLTWRNPKESRLPHEMVWYCDDRIMSRLRSTNLDSSSDNSSRAGSAGIVVGVATTTAMLVTPERAMVGVIRHDDVVVVLAGVFRQGGKAIHETSHNVLRRRIVGICIARRNDRPKDLELELTIVRIGFLAEESSQEPADLVRGNDVTLRRSLEVLPAFAREQLCCVLFVEYLFDRLELRFDFASASNDIFDYLQ